MSFIACKGPAIIRSEDILADMSSYCLYHCKQHLDHRSAWARILFFFFFSANVAGILWFVWFCTFFLNMITSMAYVMSPYIIPMCYSLLSNPMYNESIMFSITCASITRGSKKRSILFPYLCAEKRKSYHSL